MNIKFSTILFIGLCALLLASCNTQTTDKYVKICAVGYAPIKENQIIIDVENKMLHAGGDYSANILVYSTKTHQGIDTDYPFIVPRNETLKNGKTIRWERFDYHFVAVPQHDLNPHWFLITATGKASVKNTWERFTFLYSLDSGIISFRGKARNKSEIVESYVCSKRKLLIEDFMKARTEK